MRYCSYCGWPGVPVGGTGYYICENRWCFRMKQKKYPYTTKSLVALWRDAKPGSVVSIKNDEEMRNYESPIFKYLREKENKMELKLEHEIKDTVAVLRLQRLNGDIWLVARKDGYDHYLCTISNRGIERTQIMTSSGFQVDSSHRIKIVGE